MRHSPASSSRLAPVLALLATAACASPTERAETVQRVDDLLARIERVQVDSVVSKEAAQASLDELSALCASDFSGNAKQSYSKLLEKMDLSEKQAHRLRDSVEPMRQSAESVFRQWTTDLQAFGSSHMRQRSQTRLDETQSRYQAVFASSQSALIAYEAFNNDMRDHALFLGHDLNASAVAELAGDIQSLQEQVHALDVRLDAIATSARAYVESAALYGQNETEKAETPASDPKAKPAETTPAPTKKKYSTLRKRTGTSGQPTSTPETEAAPESAPVTTEPSPATNPPPTPTPPPTSGGQHPG